MELIKLEYFSIKVNDRNKIVQLKVDGPELLDQTTYLFPEEGNKVLM